MIPEANAPRDGTDTTRVLMLIGLGYLYIVFVMTALATAGILIVRAAPYLLNLVIQFGLGYLLLLIEALWVRAPGPSGRKVSRAGSPNLIDEVEAIARRLDSPLPNSVFLTADLNAAAAERPRFGIFGAPQRYLLLGLPLFDALSPGELRAVMAHELAHLSRRHGRVHLLAGRVSMSWQMLAVHIAARRRYVSWLFLPFFRWYVPKLQAAADKASRGHERESDELSGEIGTPRVAGLALLRIAVQTRRLRRLFFPSILRESAQVARAPHDVVSSMEQFLRVPLSASEVRIDVAAALEERTAPDDTHPALGERLSALGVPIDIDSLTAALADTGPETELASNLLGKQRVLKLRGELSADLLGPLSTKWRELRDLVDIWRSPEGTIRATPEATIAYARWASQTLPASEAISLLRDAVNLARKDREMAVRFGSLLLDEEQEVTTKEAIPILERVAASDSTLALTACGLLRQAYLRLGKKVETGRILARESELGDAHLHAVRERSLFKAGDDFEPAALPPDARQKLVRFLSSRPDIHRAFLVRKRTQYLAEFPFIVLALQRKVPWYKPESGNASNELCRRAAAAMEVGASAHGLVTIVESRSRLLRRLRSIPNAVLFDRAPNESWRPLAQRSRSRRLKFLPSARVMVFASMLALVVFVSRARSTRHDAYAAAYSKDRSLPADRDNITPEADIFGRRFVHLLQTRRVDSVAGLISATAHSGDSIAWARKLVGAVPDEDESTVERTLGFESHSGTVTRDVLHYTISASDGAASVVIGTVEELGVRSVEHAEVCAVPSSIARFYRSALTLLGRSKSC